jgi:hypothetical protein
VKKKRPRNVALATTIVLLPRRPTTARLLAAAAVAAVVVVAGPLKVVFVREQVKEMLADGVKEKGQPAGASTLISTSGSLPVHVRASLTATLALVCVPLPVLEIQGLPRLLSGLGGLAQVAAVNKSCGSLATQVTFTLPDSVWRERAIWAWDPG